MRQRDNQPTGIRPTPQHAGSLRVAQALAGRGGAPTTHVWQCARFTGTVTCARCGLLPLDADDAALPCTAEDTP